MAHSDQYLIYCNGHQSIGDVEMNEGLKMQREYPQVNKNRWLAPNQEDVIFEGGGHKSNNTENKHEMEFLSPSRIHHEHHRWTMKSKVPPPLCLTVTFHLCLHSSLSLLFNACLFPSIPLCITLSAQVLPAITGEVAAYFRAHFIPSLHLKLLYSSITPQP